MWLQTKLSIFRRDNNGIEKKYTYTLRDALLFAFNNRWNSAQWSNRSFFLISKMLYFDKTLIGYTHAKHTTRLIRLNFLYLLIWIKNRLNCIVLALQLGMFGVLSNVSVSCFMTCFLFSIFLVSVSLSLIWRSKFDGCVDCVFIVANVRMCVPVSPKHRF